MNKSAYKVAKGIKPEKVIEKPSSVSKGTKFEKAVEKVLNWMYAKYDNVSIEHNVFIDSSDAERQIDVLITIVVRDLVFKVAVECKDYNRKLSIGVIDGFVSKLEDVRASKGIIIASNGFSSASVGKAKRKNIILYSLGDQINLDDSALDIPVVFKEVVPYETEFEFTVSKQVAMTMKGKAIITDPLIVNGYNVSELLKSSWENQRLKYHLTNDFQILTVPELTSPYRARYSVDDDIRDEVELDKFVIRLKLKINYYTIFLKELIGLNVLENIHDNKLEMFIDVDTIMKSLPNAKPTNKTFVDDFKGVVINFLIKGDFNITTIGAEYLNILPVKRR
ncbi:restriction endonuclease [Mucilaginibacter sp. dw_454]|uniref:restriction endonuclease n=1 Tax=Mucilaginibacter sp. dw_454 TaxID=2720079 RepID=UPI001BD54818|nr:restriction endonuclease [Mucilaginibacter sp. dw_454]